MSTVDAQAPLKELKAQKEFFVGIDSDGCAFDTMEPKHKECFCTTTIWKFNLASVSKYARDAWDFVNLYSKTRGCNRFLALQDCMKYLRERDEVIRRGVSIPTLPKLAEWTERENKLGNPALIEEVARTNDPEMALVLDWSKTINEVVEKIVKNVPPFPGFPESLEALAQKADIIVCSSTPEEALIREWSEHGIDKYVRVIAGQEMGKKAEHLTLAADGQYDADKKLMIGDAPGDMSAAKAAGTLFFPINPGHEEDSWARFTDEAMGKFLDGTYAGDYEAKLIAEFDTYLPECPPWK